MMSRSPGLPPQTVGGMEFLRMVEDDLRALSVEARKKHPVVKEAAERGIVKLRALREQYAAAVRESGESPPTTMLRSQDLLRPFLLACNHSDCTRAMIMQALSAMQRLINRNAISPADAPNILRVLAIQATASSTTQEVQVKVLQTLLLTVTWRSCELPEDSLASALAVCIQLSEQRNATVKNAASATLRQIISQMFDRVGAPEGDEDNEEGGGSSSLRHQEEDDEEDDEEDLDWSQGQVHKMEVQRAYRGEPEGLRALGSVERCAYYLIQDLCLLSRGEQGTWLKHVTIPQNIGVELIEQILVQKPTLFREREVFTDVVRNQVCPLVVQTLKSGLDFPLLVRLMRTISTVVGELADLLVPQCEVILTMLTQLLSSCDLSVGSPFHAATEGVGLGAFTSQSRASKLSLWSVMLGLDVMSTICQDGWLLQTVFRNYDLLPDCTNIFAGLIKALTRFVVEGSTPVGASISMHTAANTISWTNKGLPSLCRGFELLKETAPPPINDGEVLLNAVGCILALVESLCRLTVETQLQGSLRSPVPSTAIWLPGVGPEGDCPGYLYHRMLVKADTWRDMLNLFVHLFGQSAGSEQLFDACLLSFERFIVTVHLLGVTAGRSQVLAVACKLAVPAVSLEAASGAQASGSSAPSPAVATPGMLTSRNLRATRSLLRLVGLLGNALGDNWETVLESLDLLDASVGRSLATQSAGSGGGIDAALEDLRMALRRFATFTATLEDPALSHLIRAFASHAEALLQAEQSSGRLSEGESPAISLGGGGPGSGAGGGGAGAGGGGSSSSSAASGSSSGPGLLSNSRVGEADVGPSRTVTSAAFTLRQVVCVSLFNVFRLEVVWAAVEDHLSFVACTRSSSLRLYGVNSLADLIIKALTRSDDFVGVKERVDSSVGYHSATGEVPGAVLGCLPDLGSVFNVQSELERLPGRRQSLPSSSSSSRPPSTTDDMQLLLLKPLHELGSASYLDTREHALAAFFRVLQSAGHVLDSGWPCVFDLLRSVAQAGSSGSGGEELTIDMSNGGGEVVAEELLASQWGASCLPEAFQSLKLIIDEHLDSIPKQYLADCIACMGSFGAQLVDVNVSLTSVGIVWTIADFISASPRTGPWGPEEEAIWDAIFTELGKLWLDGRPEVRNCAINTLFSCVVGHGISFPMISWRARIQAVLALKQAVDDRARSAGLGGEVGAGVGGSKGQKKGAMKVVIHHSRDTASKQWSETRVLTMQGMGRLHRAFMRHLQAQPWYGDVWTKTLESAKEAVLLDSGNTEVALAAISVLFTMLQLSSKSGLAHGPLRAAVGMKVVDGALQHAAEVVMVPRKGPAGKKVDAKEDEAFEAVKVTLWEEAWAATHAAIAYPEDEEGEIAAAFATNLQSTYESARTAELSSSERMLAFLRLVESVVEPRRPRGVGGDSTDSNYNNSSDGHSTHNHSTTTTSSSSSNRPSGSRRSAWRPPVLNCQREVLSLLKQIRSDLPEVWEFVFSFLTRYAGQVVRPLSPPPLGRGGVQGNAAAAASYAFVRLPVSKQFAKEAADCLAALYSQDHLPVAAKARAFDRVVEALGDGCLHCATIRRGVSRAQWLNLLERFASRDPAAPPFVLHEDVQLLIDEGTLLVPILVHGLGAVRGVVAESRSQSGRGLMQRWAEALLVVEGYLIPWVVQPQQQHAALNSTGHGGGDGEVPGGEEGQEEGLEKADYINVATELLKAIMDATLDSLDLALGSRVANFVTDLLLDIMLSQGGVAGSAQAGMSSVPKLGLMQAAVGHVKELLQAFLQAETSSSSTWPAAVQATKHLVRRVIHASQWLLQRYLSESRSTAAPSRAYVVAEAHALLVLTLLKDIRLPAWALPPPAPAANESEPPPWINPTDSSSSMSYQTSDSTAILASQRTPLARDTGRRAGGFSSSEPSSSGSSRVLEDLPVNSCERFSGHVLLLCPIILECISTGSSAVRGAVTDVLGGAEVADVFNAQRVALGELQQEVAKLRQEIKKTAASSGGFFS